MDAISLLESAATADTLKGQTQPDVAPVVPAA